MTDKYVLVFNWAPGLHHMLTHIVVHVVILYVDVAVSGRIREVVVAGRVVVGFEVLL